MACMLTFIWHVIRCIWFMLSQILNPKTWMSSSHAKRRHSQPCMKALLHHFAAHNSPLFVATMPWTDSSNMHPALASDFKLVHLRRCTSWQTDSRGRYLRCCIEYIFGSSLPVTVETVHRFSSIREANRSPPLHFLLVYCFLRGWTWDGGGKGRYEHEAAENLMADEADLITNDKSMHTLPDTTMCNPYPSHNPTHVANKLHNQTPPVNTWPNLQSPHTTAVTEAPCYF